jgi:hypothetical protein
MITSMLSSCYKKSPNIKGNVIVQLEGNINIIFQPHNNINIIIQSGDITIVYGKVII